MLHWVGGHVNIALGAATLSREPCCSWETVPLGLTMPGLSWSGLNLTQLIDWHPQLQVQETSSYPPSWEHCDTQKLPLFLPGADVLPDQCPGAEQRWVRAGARWRLCGLREGHLRGGVEARRGPPRVVGARMHPYTLQE